MDMMEVPSHFYQMYASDPRTLQMFAHHFQSGESVPPALIDRLLVGLRTGSALSLQEQVSSLLSFTALHPPRPIRLPALILGLPSDADRKRSLQKYPCFGVCS